MYAIFIPFRLFCWALGLSVLVGIIFGNGCVIFGGLCWALVLSVCFLEGIMYSSAFVCLLVE